MSLETFNVYPELWAGKRHFHVRVRLFDTRKQMLREIKASMLEACENTEGMCFGITHYNRKGRMTGRFAVMFLNRHDLCSRGAEIVAHECVHAGLRLMSARKLKVQDASVEAGACCDAEEALAYAVGQMTAQLGARLQTLRVFP
jgi:hypothetical protein